MWCSGSSGEQGPLQPGVLLCDPQGQRVPQGGDAAARVHTHGGRCLPQEEAHFDPGHPPGLLARAQCRRQRPLCHAGAGALSSLPSVLLFFSVLIFSGRTFDTCLAALLWLTPLTCLTYLT